jgi:hypothetical protein
MKNGFWRENETDEAGIKRHALYTYQIDVDPAGYTPGEAVTILDVNDNPTGVTGTLLGTMPRHTRDAAGNIISTAGEVGLDLVGGPVAATNKIVGNSSGFSSNVTATWFVEVASLGYNNKGFWLIDVTEPPRNGDTFSWAGSSTARRSWAEQKAIILNSPSYVPTYATRDGIQFPPKYRVYNSPGHSYSLSTTDLDYSMEVYDNSLNAPDIPLPLQNLKATIASELI